MKGINVFLTRDEVEVAVMLGARRILESIYSGRRNNHGLPASSWDIDINGRCYEMAAGKGLNFYCGPGLCTFKGADLSTDIQVRGTEHENGSLVVREADSDEHYFVLVVGRIPRYRLVGWLKGSEAKDQRFLSQKGNDNRPPAYFVPQEALRDFPNVLSNNPVAYAEPCPK